MVEGFSEEALAQITEYLSRPEVVSQIVSSYKLAVMGPEIGWFSGILLGLALVLGVAVGWKR